ncbi:MAG: hypothetical protein A3H62_03710 [Candidatus Ryanbacteria bacterium RIFCSPLOWO2_02_FULL_44_40]|nr:MAG: hypothetical protein A3H62_03710 [Candidatus Ryanbacteria bacterium RIFCSPLOWO2_02_FULL_44_40]
MGAVLLIIALAALLLLGRENKDGFLDNLFSGGFSLPGGKDIDLEDDDGAVTGGAESRSALFMVSDGPVAAATISGDGDGVLFYRSDVGHLYKTALTGGAAERVSNLTIPSTINAEWSTEKETAMVTFIEENRALRYFVLHYVGTTTEGVVLPKETYAATLSPNGENIAYAVAVGDGASVVIASSSGKEQKNVLFSELADIELSWITDDLLFLKTRSSAFAPSILWSLSVSGKTQTLLTPKEGLGVLFSPDGGRFLYSETLRGGRDLALYVANNNDEYLKLPATTLSEKCVWSNKQTGVVFCAVPQKLSGLPLPDSWWSGEVSFIDDLWRIDTETGEATMVWDQNDFDMVKMFLSPEEDYLFFVNKKDSTLWAVRLAS